MFKFCSKLPQAFKVTPFDGYYFSKLRSSLLQETLFQKIYTPSYPQILKCPKTYLSRPEFCPEHESGEKISKFRRLVIENGPFLSPTWRKFAKPHVHLPIAAKPRILNESPIYKDIKYSPRWVHYFCQKKYISVCKLCPLTAPFLRKHTVFVL